MLGNSIGITFAQVNYFNNRNTNNNCLINHAMSILFTFLLLNTLLTFSARDICNHITDFNQSNIL